MNSLSTSQILDQVSDLEKIAQSYFDQAALCHKHRLAEGEVRFVARGLAAQDRADQLRKVLAERRAELKRRKVYVGKLIEAQVLAHSALQAVQHE
jgi:uncharacterized protein with von Willebrand factor type A (vWA) domain